MIVKSSLQRLAIVFVLQTLAIALVHKIDFLIISLFLEMPTMLYSKNIKWAFVYSPMHAPTPKSIGYLFVKNLTHAQKLLNR